jgi:hypothetical protein
MGIKALHVILAFFGIIGGVATLMACLALNARYNPLNPFSFEGRIRNALVGLGILAVLGFELLIIDWFW